MNRLAAFDIDGFDRSAVVATEGCSFPGSGDEEIWSHFRLAYIALRSGSWRIDTIQHPGPARFPPFQLTDHVETGAPNGRIHPGHNVYGW